LYTAVRARNIMRKYGEATGKDEPAAAAEITAWPAETFAGLEPEAASLLMDLLETPRVLDAAVNSLELSLLARHFYLLAQGFNNYYHKYPVIKEGVSDSDKKRRLKFVQLFERHFKTGLETILGIPVPERM
jgi:arginyl-tRNA synthetase